MNNRKNLKTYGKLIAILIFTMATSGLLAQEVLTIEKALQYAESGSPDLKRTLLNRERYQKSLEAQRAALKSQFSLDVTPIEYSNTRRFDQRVSEWYTNESLSPNATFRIQQPILPTDGTISLINKFGWQNSNSETTAGLTESKIFSNNLYLMLSQPIFTYNRTKVELKQLELNLENADISYAMQRLNLERTVTQYFYNVYLAQENLSIARSELENTQKSHDIIKNKVDAGLAAKEELYQAELNLATSESSFQNSEVSLENAKDQLKLYLGMDLYSNVTVLADISSRAIDVNLDVAIENGLNSRMELRQREIDIENGMFSMLQVKAQNEFVGDVNLSFGITGDNEKLNNIFDNITKNPQVSVSFSIPLWDWGEKKARIASQEATNKTYELSLDEEKRGIIIDIRQTVRNLQNQLKQIEIAQQNQTNAQLTYDINLERYENGDLTGMDLNLYQVQLSQSKVSLAEARINYKLELLNLKIQSLYDFEKKEPIIPSELYLNDK
ncbi:MAG: TolC family protein [Prolixibacteraceae bacterium]|nr:TolC family protein [Prolixibacteraceae bacterium]